MRNHLINLVISSNVDLAVLSNGRMKIWKVGDGLYKVTSSFRTHRNEGPYVAYQFLKRRMAKRNMPLTHVCGNCSCPTGYVFRQ